MEDKICSISIIAQIFDKKKIDPSNPLADQINMDSLGWMELVVEIEQEFNIDIDPGYLIIDNFDTIESIVTLVQILTNGEEPINSPHLDNCETNSDRISFS